MKRFLAILLALSGCTYAQTNITVVADTNRVIRTNFTLGTAQVTGLQTALDAKLSTTNVLEITNGGTGAASAAGARTALGLGTAATNAATAFQPANTNLTALASGDGSSLTNVGAITDASGLTNFPAELLRTNGDGSGLSGISVDLTTVLPAYSNNAGKVLAVLSNETDVEWIAISNTVTDASTLTNFPAGILQTNSSNSLFPAFLLRTNGDAAGLSNLPTAISLLPSYSSNAGKVLAVASNESSLEWIAAGGGSGTVTSVAASGGTTGLAFSGSPITNSGTLTLGGTLAIGNGGTGAENVTNARVNLLPAYSGNAGKVLAINSGGTDLEWVSGSGVSLPVSIVNGGTGATNGGSALINLGALNTNNGVTLGESSSAVSGVAIGNSARAVSTNGTDGANGVAIGPNAYASTNGVSVGQNAGSISGLAIGNGALSGAEAIAIGKNASAEPGIAIGTGADAYEVGAVALGDNAYSDNTNGIQIGTGTNSTANAVQFNTWGLVNSNKWAALANSTTFGAYVMAAPTNGTANQVLALNSNATAAVWTSAGSGVIDLSTTNATGTLPVAKGGTGGTNGLQAQTNLGIVTDSGTTVVIGTTTSGTNRVVIGTSATAGARGVSVGHDAESNAPDSIAIGNKVAISASSGTNSIAIGANSGIFAANNAIQLGVGTNSNNLTIQFRSAGNVDETEWGALANSSTQGRYAMTNTAGISATNTIIGYDGTNYVTNTITVINGIITGWTQ